MAQAQRKNEVDPGKPRYGAVKQQLLGLLLGPKAIDAMLDCGRYGEEIRKNIEADEPLKRNRPEAYQSIFWFDIAMDTAMLDLGLDDHYTEKHEDRRYEYDEYTHDEHMAARQLLLEKGIIESPHFGFTKKGYRALRDAFFDRIRVSYKKYKKRDQDKFFAMYMAKAICELWGFTVGNRCARCEPNQPPASNKLLLIPKAENV
jgi:hypothetical protein